jgi:Tol biopolymer transport system component
VSPDGAVIALIDRELKSLVMLDARTGETRSTVGIATRDAGHAPAALPVLGGPSWSPDGSRLAFNCWDGHGDEICVVGANGSGIRQLTHIETRTYPSEPPPGAFRPAVANAGPPSWSPDGTEIALAVYPEQRGAPAGVFVVDLEAGAARRISSMLPNSEITWFADGESLLFSARDQGRSDVLRAPLDSQAPEKLTAALDGGAREPALSPDENHLAVSSDHVILVLDREGNIDHAMGNGLAQRLPAWSPDGERVAFEASQDAILNYP